MAAKRTAANDQLQQGVKRRIQFPSGEEGPEGIHMHHGHIDHSSNDDGQGGAGVSMESFEGDGTFASMDQGAGAQDSMIREQDRFLPIANVSRIMKRVLPESGKVAKEAKECVQECVSEFISFITSEASERCLHEKRKTINGEDILWAMQTLGFDPYVEPLKIYLSKYRMSAKGDKQSAGASTAPPPGYGLITVMGEQHEPGSDDGKHGGASNQTATGPLYLTQDDLVLGPGEHRQVQLATNADGQLTIIEMRTDADGNVETGDGGTTAITLPMLSGSSTGENGAQQYILTALDQSGMGGAGVQQFTIPAGAQLAFINPGGANGQGGQGGAQGIPVMFLDSAASSHAGGHHQSPQYITMNASGTGGLQIIHVNPSTMMTGASGADEGRGDSHSATLTIGDEGQ